MKVTEILKQEVAEILNQIAGKVPDGDYCHGCPFLEASFFVECADEINCKLFEQAPKTKIIKTLYADSVQVIKLPVCKLMKKSVGNPDEVTSE